MLDRKVIISKHATERFQQRGIKFYKNKNSIIRQIKFDLKPLNIRFIEKISDTDYKVITKQGKCYVTQNIGKNKTLIKTVYKLNRRDLARSGMIG